MHKNRLKLNKVSTFKMLGIMLSMIFLQGCETGYYLHLLKGQTQLLTARQPTIELLQQSDLEPKLHQRLMLTQTVLTFAKEVLELPVDGQYSTYVQLERPYALWSLSAAPELSLQPYQWCYPLVGCANYRGYFDLARGEATQAKMQAQGFDTVLRGVSAYSTLGWFEDPILSSFDRYSDEDYIELLFHELAHAQLYIKNDTIYNESFATFVGRRGLELFKAQGLLAEETQTAPNLTSRQRQADAQAFRTLLAKYAAQLEQIYATTGTDEWKRIEKTNTFAKLRAEYADIKTSWHWPTAYDHWMAKANNASITLINDYEALVPEFARLFEQCNQEWACFYKQAANTQWLDE